MLILNGKKYIMNVKVCKTLFSQARGLMFSKSLGKDQCLFFEFNNEQSRALHMLFVFFSIDMIILDKSFHVVEIIPNVRPFRIYIMPKKPFKYLIEAKKGRASEVKIGDMIKFKYQ